jgi:hypothetical protein
MSVFRVGSNKSSVNNFPSVRPTLDLDFANSKTLDPRITFTRASGGSYTGADGLIKYAGVNEARFDHDPATGESLGLLIEESRTNLLLRSEEFNDAGWSKGAGSVSSNIILAPDGTNSADAFTEDTSSNNYHFFQQNITKTASSITYTFSTFAKSKGGRIIGMRLDSSSNGVVSAFDLVSGTIRVVAGTYGTGFSNASSTITSYPNNWYRITLTVTSNTATSLTLQFYLDNGSTSVYTGDGTSGVYIWGAQVEQGSFPTSYIPTQGSSRTRAADNASITGKNFSEWYNQSEGTMVAQGKRVINVTDFSRIVSFNDNSSLNMLSIYTEVNKYQGFKAINGSQNFFAGPTIVNSMLNQSKVALSHNTTNATIVTNGVFLGEANISGTALVTRMTIGVEWYLAGYYNGTIRRLTYYPKRLPNAQLQALTK